MAQEAKQHALRGASAVVIGVQVIGNPHERLEDRPWFAKMIGAQSASGVVGVLVGALLCLGS